MMRTFLGTLLLACAIVVMHSDAPAQKKETTKTEKKAEAKGSKSESKVKKDAAPKSEDPLVGKTKEGKPVYEGARGGFYYITEGGSKSYVKDFVGAKVVGKTADGLPIYEGPRGGRFYYSASGEKVYVKK